jgi:polyhydroxyalkanoate synthesis regulator phasin
MLKELKESIDKGLEYATMTKDKLTKAANELAKENKLTKEEAKKLMDHLVRKSEEARKSLEHDLQDLVHGALKKMNVPAKEDLRKLEERIKKLESFHKTPAKPKAKPVAVKKPKPAAPKKKTVK